MPTGDHDLSPPRQPIPRAEIEVINQLVKHEGAIHALKLKLIFIGGLLVDVQIAQPEEIRLG